MASGFAQARGIEPPAAPAKPAATEAPATEKTADASAPAGEGAKAEGDTASAAATQQDQQVQAAKEVLAGLTEEQLKSVLGEVPALRDRLTSHEGQMRKIFGKLGEFQHAFASLTKGGAGQPVKIDAGRLKHFKSALDDTAAEALANDLQEILSELPRGSALPTDLDERIQRSAESTQQAVLRTVHETLLTTQHPDWKDLVGTPDFRLWLETKPEADRQKIATSEDATFLSPQFAAFKAWKERAGAARAAKEKRLESATTPKGTPTPSSAAPVVDTDAAFAAGFRAVRG